MSQAILLIVIALSTFTLYSQKFNLEPERIIGKEGEDKYTFFKITDIKFNKRGGFLVSDKGRVSVSLYNQRGKFVKRTVRLHSSSINAIGAGEKYIYICDTLNRRFMVYTHKLNFVKSMSVEGSPVEIINVYKDGSFLTTNYTDSGKGYGRVVKLNPKGKVEYSFFNQAWWGKLVKGYRKHDFVKKYGLAVIQGGYGNGKVIFGFRESDNPTEIFIYSDKGKKTESLKYRTSGPYKLNPCSCSEEGVKDRYSPEKREEIRHHVEFSSAFIYKGYRIVFIKYRDVNWCMRETRKNMFLVFNETGELVHEEDLCNDLTFFDMDEKGCLIGADLNADIVSVQIYKIVF